jgi:endonuclease/exonuclease/phosphatase family metal-dependent hydrolase
VTQRARHVVLVGDLDAEPDAASVRFLAGKQSLDRMSVCYRNAWDSQHPGEAGHTFTAQNSLMAQANWDWPFQRIDHILVRCGRHGGPTLRIVACELAFNESVQGVWASDHFGLVADLVIPQGSIECQM